MEGDEYEKFDSIMIGGVSMILRCRYLLSILEQNAKNFWDVIVIKSKFHSTVARCTPLCDTATLER
jgi:hypothetical protein